MNICYVFSLCLAIILNLVSCIRVEQTPSTACVSNKIAPKRARRGPSEQKTFMYFTELFANNNDNLSNDGSPSVSNGLGCDDASTSIYSPLSDVGEDDYDNEEEDEENHVVNQDGMAENFKPHRPQRPHNRPRPTRPHRPHRPRPPRPMRPHRPHKPNRPIGPISPEYPFTTEYPVRPQYPVIPDHNRPEYPTTYGPPFITNNFLVISSEGSRPQIPMRPQPPNYDGMAENFKPHRPQRPHNRPRPTRPHRPHRPRPPRPMRPHRPHKPNRPIGPISPEYPFTTEYPVRPQYPVIPDHNRPEYPTTYGPPFITNNFLVISSEGSRPQIPMRPQPPNYDGIRPVNEEMDDQQDIPWRPNGVVGGSNGYIWPLLQDLSHWSTRRPPPDRATVTGRRNYNRGIITSFLDLF